MTHPTRGLAISIETGPAYEFLLSLGVWAMASDRDMFDIGSAWFADAGARLAPELRAAIIEFAQGNDWVWVHLISVAFAQPDRSVSALITAIETMPAEDLLLYLVGYYVRYFRRATPPEIMAAAVAGEAPARAQFLATSYPDDARWQGALHYLLSRPPQTIKEQLVDILRGWEAQVFRAQQEELMRAIERDAAARRAQVATLTPTALISAVTNGWDYVPEPGIQRITLIPSVVIRPETHSWDHHEVKIFCYPVADEYLDADPAAPPAGLTRLLKALGDERRLRLLREIAAHALTQQDLAQRLNMSKTLAHHHLVILRSAGLIRLRGARTYALRPEALVGLPGQLRRYLTPELPE